MMRIVILTLAVLVGAPVLVLAVMILAPLVAFFALLIAFQPAILLQMVFPLLPDWACLAITWAFALSVGVATHLYMRVQERDDV